MTKWQLRTTADKRLRSALPQLPSATCFIRKMLGNMFYKNKEVKIIWHL